MADRVSASIAIGGKVSPTQLAELAAHIADYDLRTEWDGEPFDPIHLPQEDAMRLFAHEVPWGIFDTLEQFCCDSGLAYSSEEHTSELQSLMRISYAVFCLKKKKT